MRSKKARTRYYIFFLYDGKYEYRPTEDIYDAHQELTYFSNKPGFLGLGIYDPQDSYFSWSVDEEAQREHFDKVIEITVKLGQQYEDRLR